MAMLEKEDFWGCGLKKGSKVVFNPEFEDSELSEVEHKLILSQACLGPKATGRSIVEVTAQDYKGEEVSFSIAALREGATEMCPLNLSFSPPVTFKLVEGSGPVHLTGNHVQSLTEEESESEDDEDSASELVETTSPVKNKRPLPTSTKKGPPNKLAKIADNEESDEEDTDEEESDEEDENSPKAMKQDKQQLSKLVMAEAEEEESDEEDDDYEDESNEEEEQEESEEESEDELAVVKTLTGQKKKEKDAKKPTTNGVASKKGVQDQKKSQTKTPNKTPNKTAQQKTPKAEAKSPQPKDINTIKQALLKSPALPKKIEKFKNVMRSSYKITDEETVKDLWDYVEKNKKK